MNEVYIILVHVICGFELVTINGNKAGTVDREHTIEANDQKGKWLGFGVLDK
jgi:hypothetical protein